MAKRASFTQEPLPHENDELLTADQAAKFLGYRNVGSLGRQRRDGGLKAEKINKRTFRYWRSELIAFLKRGTNKKAAGDAEKEAVEEASK